MAKMHNGDCPECGFAWRVREPARADICPQCGFLVEGHRLKAEVEKLKAFIPVGTAQASRIAELEADVERLQAVVDKLPVAADEVRWIPNPEGELYHPDEAGSFDDIEFDDGWRALWFSDTENADPSTPSTTCRSYAVEDCYSTQAAAEAAKG